MEWDCIECRASNFRVDVCECGTPRNELQGVKASITREVTKEDILIIAATSPFIHGKRILKTISFVSSEEAVALSYFDQFAAGVTAKWGGKSSVIGESLGEIKDSCLNKLKKSAVELGANAIVSISASYNDIFSGSTLLVTMTGTAVLIEE